VQEDGGGSRKKIVGGRGPVKGLFPF